MMAGADIENLVNQAALQAARLGKDAIDMKDLEYAKDKILMGRLTLFCFVPDRCFLYSRTDFWNLVIFEIF